MRYVMEGSVRRVGNSVRINAQLIDATTGGHIWAERYDGSLDDVFAMQDGITSSIVAAMEVNLVGDEQEKLTRIETDNTAAYEAFLRGWERYRQGTPEDLAKAIPYFEQAIELDPDYARALAALAATHWNIVLNGWSRIVNLPLIESREQTRIALDNAMQKPIALTHQVASERAAFFEPTPENALIEAESAIALDVNDPSGHIAMASALLNAGRPGEAAESVRTAMRLDRHYRTSYTTRLGQAQYAMGQFEAAAETLESAVERNPCDDWTFVYLVATCGQLGRLEDASWALQQANALRARAG